MLLPKVAHKIAELFEETLRNISKTLDINIL